MCRPGPCACAPTRWSTGTIMPSLEPGIGKRAVHWPRGRVLGGTSRINGMLYVRGNPADGDAAGRRWAAAAGAACRCPALLQEIRERCLGRSRISLQQGRPVAGRENYRTILPLTHRFVEAAQQAGFPLTADFHNGALQEAWAPFADDPSRPVVAARPRGKLSSPSAQPRQSARSSPRRSQRASPSRGGAAPALPFARTARRTRWLRRAR